MLMLLAAIALASAAPPVCDCGRTGICYCARICCCPAGSCCCPGQICPIPAATDTPADDVADLTRQLAEVRARIAELQRKQLLEAGAQAVREGRACLIFVGCPGRPVPGAIVIAVDSLAGYDPGVAVARPLGDWLEWLYTLPVDASDTDLAAAAICATPICATPNCAVPRPAFVPRSAGSF